MGFDIYYKHSNLLGITNNSNAIFTFEVNNFAFDIATGNYTKSPAIATEQVYANIIQGKDPNLELQPGLDYSRIYFSGYLVEPKAYPRAMQAVNIPCIINGKKGLFDFIPVFESAEASALAIVELVGQRITGYFRMT